MRNIRDALRTLILAAIVGLGIGAISFQVAGATTPPGIDDEITPVGPDAVVETDLFNLTPFVVTLVSSIIIPWLIAFVTKAETKAWFKKTLLALLAAIAGVIQVSITPDGGAWISESTVKAAFLTFLGSVGVYMGWVRNSSGEAAANRVGPDLGPTEPG